MSLPVMCTSSHSSRIRASRSTNPVNHWEDAELPLNV
jgi:hypothetical protein